MSDRARHALEMLLDGVPRQGVARWLWAETIREAAHEDDPDD